MPKTPRAAVLVALAAALAGCGSSSSQPKTLNTHQTEIAIQQALLSQRHLSASVTCPTTVKEQAGVTFTCYAVTKKYGSTPFHVTVQNDKGYVTFHS